MTKNPNGAPLRAVIYARRSQKHQDASVATQVEEAERFVRSMGWSLVGAYRDEGENTGRREFQKRKEFLRLIEDASRDLFDVVVVRDTSRLGGDTSRTMRVVEDLCDDGVQVWCYVDKREVKLVNSTDKIIFAVQSAAAEGERDAISSRTYEALMVRARAGFNAGGSCYGYDNKWIVEGNVKKRTEYVVNEAEAAIVRNVFELYAEGLGFRAIACELNRRGVASPRAGKRGTGSWSPGVIRPMLLRERYRGVVVYGLTKKTYKKGTKVRVLRSSEDVVREEVPHLRIVSEKLWLAVQARFARNRTFAFGERIGRKARYLLASISRCALCGGPIHAKRGKVGSEAAMVYLCGYHQDRATCTNSLRSPMDEVDDACIAWIRDNILTERVVLAVLNEVRRRLEARVNKVDDATPTLAKEADALRRECNRLAEAIATSDTSMTTLVAKLGERQKKLTQIEARIASTKTAPRALSFETRRLEVEAKKRIAELRDLFARGPEGARRAMQSLLEGPLTFTPIDTIKGRRYRVEGRVTTGALLSASSFPQWQRPQGDSNPR